MPGKAFADGDVLTATDVNQELNPHTATHLASRVAAGRATAWANNSTGATRDVTFPSGRFTEPPIVTCSTASGLYGVSHGAVTTAGVTFRVYPLTAGGTVKDDVPIEWIAVQMRPTSATG